MVILKNYGDPVVYRTYYRAQAGYAVPGCQGTPFMYGAVVGGIFWSFFRKAVPLLSRGLDIIKPHVKTTTKNIAKDVGGHASQALLNKVNQPTPQEGSGLMYTQRRKGVKRKASHVCLVGQPQPFKRKAMRSQKLQKKKTEEESSGKEEPVSQM